MNDASGNKTLRQLIYQWIKLSKVTVEDKYIEDLIDALYERFDSVVNDIKYTPSPAPFNVPGQVVGVEPYISPTDKANQKPQGFNPPAPSIVWPKDRKHAGCCSGNIGHCICGAEEANEMLDACKSAVAKAGVLVALDLSKLKKYSGIYGLPPKEYTLVNVEDLEKFAAPSQEPLDEIKTAKMLWEKSKLKTKFHRDNGAIEYKTVTFREFRVMVRLINLSLGELIAAPSQGVNEELLQALKWCCTELILITNANPHLKGIGYDHAMLKNKDAIATAEKEKTNVHT